MYKYLLCASGAWNVPAVLQLIDAHSFHLVCVSSDKVCHIQMCFYFRMAKGAAEEVSAQSELVDHLRTWLLHSQAY